MILNVDPSTHDNNYKSREEETKLPENVSRSWPRRPQHIFKILRNAKNEDAK